ncbi:MAG: hypothetical protein CMJ24_05560 [Phycisphaerae bacterium]|nr:hypothetical protein [Phycisphaerae bacterium]|tara:strand:+ start:3222 stop:4004 length:783 start_codon:yes stop_codon:yes gene_type:complete
MIRLAIIPLVLVAAAATAQDHCGTGSANIPDGSSSTVWSIDVPGSDDIIAGITLRTSIDHPWVGDLSLRLTAPDGTTALLLDRPGIPDVGGLGPWGCGGDDLDCTFDDGASSDAEATCSLTSTPVLTGSLAPLQSMDAFVGTDPSGIWTIEIVDHSFIDAGTVQQICLTLDTAPDCNGNGLPDATDIDGGGSNDADDNGVPDECQCQGDTNGDLTVDVVDLLSVLEQWGCSVECTADLDGDSNVNVTDLLAVIASWGSCR